MKIAGIVLLCLQAVALLGGIANGSLVEMFTAGVMGIVQFVGFCLPAIIGVILLLKAKKKSEK